MNGSLPDVPFRVYQCAPILFSPLYQTPGTLDAVLANLSEQDPETATLARAYALYYRGDIPAGATEARKLLSAERRFPTTLGVSHVLALEAMVLGDTEKWNAARELVVRSDYATDEELALKDFNLASLDFSLFVKTSFPKWFCEGCFDLLPADSFSAARYIYGKLLFTEARYAELAAVAEPMISQSHAEGALLSEVYLRIIAAMGRYATGDNKRMEYHLRRALELALPDGLLSPFAEYRRHLGQTLDKLLRDMDMNAYKTVVRLNDVILEGWTKLFNALYGTTYTNALTGREYDVARFALMGMSNAEIAGRMDISVNTVKLYLRNIYEKLGICKRNELVHYIWDDE